MTLFAAEMRKIWRPLPILILIAMGALWTFVGIMPAFGAYTEDDAYQPGLGLTLTGERRLVRRYGPLTDKATIDRMKADIPRLKRQATRDIQTHPKAAKTLGISDFAGYERWNDSVADTPFLPTGKPNILPAGITETGARTAEGAAIAAAKKKHNPISSMSDKQLNAMWDADNTLIKGSEALQDLYNIGMLMRSFPITSADAKLNLDESVAMLRSTASTDHPVTPIQKQYEREYRADAEHGWSQGTAGGCASMDITGKTVTKETGGRSSGGTKKGGTTGDTDNDGTANRTDGTGTAANNDSGTGDGTAANGTNGAGDAATDTGDGTASANTDGTNDTGSDGDAQIGTGCDPDDAASIGSQSYSVPGTMPKAVTERLARYAADPGRSSYLQYHIMEKTWTYATLTAVFAVVASAAFIIPVMVRDRGRRMIQLQWASRSGRAGQHARVAAMALSSLIVGLLTLIAFGAPLVALLRDFLAVPVLNVNSNVSIAGISFRFLFGVPIVPWVYWTFGQYLAAIGATVLALTLAVTMAGAWLCRTVRSIIRMLLVMVPLLALILLPASLVYFPNMFLMGNWLTNRLTAPGLEAWIPLTVLGLAVVAWLVSTVRLRRRELVD